MKILIRLISMAAPNLVSDFETDAESWRTNDAGTTLIWEATGGATGAYLEGEGPGSMWHLVSPASWAGDWSDYRALKFDLGIPSRHYPDDDIAGMVMIVGTNSSAMTWTGPTPLWSWSRYEISLDPASFGVDQATFDAVMAYVTKIWIQGEYDAGNDHLWPDNIVVATGPAAPVAPGSALASRFGTDDEGWLPYDNATIGWDGAAGFSGGAIACTDGGTGTAWLDDAGLQPPGTVPAPPPDRLATFDADSDHDGQTNRDEYLALTAPDDPLSRFTADARKTPGGFAIDYPTRSGRVYQVWKATNPALPGSWAPVGPAVIGDDTLKSHIDATSDPAAFFRVGVGLP